MRTFLLLALSTGCLLAQSPVERSNALYQAGLIAMNQGDVAKARQAFTEALQLNPGHANARYQLGQLKLNSAQIAGKGHEQQLAKIVVPQISLDGASLEEALEALTAIVTRESKQQVTPNFVVQDSAAAFKSRKINLQLRGVPANKVLEFILSQAGGTAKYEEHAVVIKPNA